MIKIDIVVTIPKKEYNNDDLETEYFLNNPDAVQFWAMKRVPKKLKVDDRVYFVRENKIECSMQFYDIEYNAENVCDVTNRKWSGCILYLNDLKYENLSIKIKGFQGFRYRWWKI